MRKCHGLLSALLAVALAGNPGSACELALALAVDISGSVDAREFDIQMQGLAAGLTDPEVSEALVRNRAAIMLVQWTGTSRQAVSVPWTRIGSAADVAALATAISGTRRRWERFSTAIGEALLFTARQFDHVPDCQRRVIDVSGDGPSNEGPDPRNLRADMLAQGITVNALVIEENLSGLRDYFRESVIVGPGAFVVIANSFKEYPERMRDKLRRETERQLSLLR